MQKAHVQQTGPTSNPVSRTNQRSHMQSMIVFSHLRWDFVFQRPQHLMTRLAQAYRVFFIEEPVASDGPPSLDISEPAPNVHVCRPRLPSTEGGFACAEAPALQRLIEELLATHGIR